MRATMGAKEIEPSLAPGVVVGGKYRLERLLGEGGMALVWSARHVLTQRAVALKLLRSREPVSVRRFLREARIAGKLVHPNIVQVHDVLQLEDGTPGLVMELLVGESLAALLARRGRLPVPDAARVMSPVVSAVETAHRAGVVHRDLKPENIFVAPASGGSEHVTVLDFGIAKVLESEDPRPGPKLTETGAVIGTPHYMAPEQVFGEGVDARADVWAIGVILHELLVGKRPIDGDNYGQVFKAVALGKIPRVHERASDVPDGLAVLVDRMLERDRDARPTLADVRAALASYAGSEASAPSPRRLPWIAGSIVAVLALVLVGSRVVSRPAPALSLSPEPGVAHAADPSAAPDSVVTAATSVVVTTNVMPSASPSATVVGTASAAPKKKAAQPAVPAVSQSVAQTSASSLPGGVHGVSPY